MAECDAVPGDRNLWTPEHHRIERMATCVHEAGHAVLNLLFGIEFEHIRIVSDSSGWVNCGDPHDWEHAVVAAAGLAAELVWLTQTNHPEMADAAYAGASADTAMLRAVVSAHKWDELQIRRKAHELVTGQWPKILQLGTVLTTAPRQTGKSAQRTTKVVAMNRLPMPLN